MTLDTRLPMFSGCVCYLIILSNNASAKMLRTLSSVQQWDCGQLSQKCEELQGIGWVGGGLLNLLWG